MNRYAIIINGVVSNVAVWDETSQWELPLFWLTIQLFDGESCAPGWIYSENADPRFIAPPDHPIQRRWTAYEFLQRFTAAERATMRSLAQTDENVADFLQLLQAAQEVVSDDPMTVAGMDYAVSVGIVTAERKTEILS